MPKSDLAMDGSVGPIQLSICVGGNPLSEGAFAPHLHIKAFHEKVKTITIGFRPDEVVEMQVPPSFNNNDMLDSDYETVPSLPTYKSKIPFWASMCRLSHLKMIANQKGSAIALYFFDWD